MIRSILGCCYIFFVLSSLTSCPGSPGSKGSLGPYPVTGIDDNRFYRDLSFDQERNLQVAPFSSDYSDVRFFYENGLPSYLHLDAVTGKIYTSADEITAVAADATLNVDFWTDDSDGRISVMKTITLTITEISS